MIQYFLEDIIEIPVHAIIWIPAISQKCFLRLSLTRMDQQKYYD